MASRNPKIEVSLAEGNTLLLTALSDLFESDQRFSLISTATSTESCLQALVSVPSDILVIDWVLPSFGAERLIKVLRDRASPVRVVVCTHAASMDVAKRSMAAGAAGYFSHSEPAVKLRDIVADVAAGNMIFPYLDVRELSDPLQSLTRTERALLTSLSQGLTNKELATKHGIAVNTVKFHLRNLYDKLDVKNRSQAIALYYSLNLPDNIVLPEVTASDSQSATTTPVERKSGRRDSPDE